MTTGWDGFACRRREIFGVPLCPLWDPAVRILRSHLNGMGWAHLGCMWDGDGTGSWDAFTLINGDHMGIHENLDGMG